jgi:uncharacterized protein (DUF2141 family)
MMSGRFGLLGCVLLLASAPPCSGAELRVIVEGIGTRAGTIIAGLYDSHESYRLAVAESSRAMVNDPRRLVGVSLRPTADRHSIVFSDLRPGVYAVVVFHDENDDGKLDKNAIGLPTEAYAISNNARGLLGAPDFKDAAVHIANGDDAIRVTLIYPRGLTERP